MKSNTLLSCINCGENTQADNANQIRLEATVASDCRPQPWAAEIWQCPHCQQIQKQPTAEYRQNVNAIYQSYAANPLTQGAEQLNYSSDVPLPRCQQILDNARAWLSPWATSPVNMLDIGTGSGVMLDAAHAQFSQWQLYAHDVSDHHADFLMQKLPLSGFIAGELDGQVTQQYQHHFHVISMIHVLEHVLNPQELLSQIAALLTDDGVLLIQVPFILENPWDLGIYDHVQHFDVVTLCRLVEQVFPYVELMQSPIQKEITLVATKSLHHQSFNQAEHSQSLRFSQSNLATHAHYAQPLASIRDELQRLQQQLLGSAMCVLLGTGPAAGLLLSSAKQWQLHLKIVAIVDEDERKWGSEFGGVRVIAPADMPADAELLLPYPLAQREQIEKRMAHLRTQHQRQRV